MTTKATVIALRFITVFLFFRIGVTAVEDGSIFLLIVSAGLAILFLKMPKIVQSC